MAMSETLICKMALDKLGAKPIENISEDSVQARACRRHYDQARDSLLRGHSWKFALSRKVLSQDTTDPAFEWDYQFILPTDCLRVIGLYDTTASYALEGKRLLTNDSSASIWYIKRIEDPTDFDSLFVDALVLSLAVRLSMSLTEDPRVRQDVKDELIATLRNARLVNFEETNTVGTDDVDTWLDARRTGVT